MFETLLRKSKNEQSSLGNYDYVIIYEYLKLIYNYTLNVLKFNKKLCSLVYYRKQECNPNNTMSIKYLWY